MYRSVDFVLYKYIYFFFLPFFSINCLFLFFFLLTKKSLRFLLFRCNRQILRSCLSSYFQGFLVRFIHNGFFNIFFMNGKIICATKLTEMSSTSKSFLQQFPLYMTLFFLFFLFLLFLSTFERIPRRRFSAPRRAARASSETNFQRTCLSSRRHAIKFSSFAGIVIDGYARRPSRTS